MKLVISAPATDNVEVSGPLEHLYSIVRDDVRGRGGSPDSVRAVMWKLARPVFSIRGATFGDEDGNMIAAYRITGR